MEATAQPSPSGSNQRGFFESLMDTRFDNLITPKLIRFLYIVSMIALAIGALVWIVAGFAHSAGTGVLFLVLAPLAALVYLIVVRLYLELIVVAFKIRDATEETAINTRPRIP
jgi:magnesium-transporting ATPase (P-type)